jgi:hypothetical protein
MGFQVIDCHEGAAQRVGHRLGGIHADHQRASQPWPLRDRHRVDLAAIDAGIGQRLFDNRDDGGDMAPRGELWDNAPMSAVDLELGRDDGREDPAAIGDDGG